MTLALLKGIERRRGGRSETKEGESCLMSEKPAGSGNRGQLVRFYKPHYPLLQLI